jgi:hypothetical protein
MRIWDLPAKVLCRQHLLGEHRELHGLWNILTLGKRGYSLHPETLRWVGKTAALYARHQELVAEMQRRGYRHNSPLDRKLATGRRTQAEFLISVRAQRKLLRKKGCDCGVNSSSR